MSDTTQSFDYTATEFPIKINEKFPRKILGGITLVKNTFSWRALVVIAESEKKYIKFYSWQMRKDEWKIQLCNMKTKGSYWNDIGEHISQLTELYMN